MVKPFVPPMHRKAVKEFEEAVRAHDNMGAQHPEDHAAIEAKYEQAKVKLLLILAK